MKKIVLLFLICFSMHTYGYSLGVGVIGGGGATDIEDLENTTKCENCITEIDYKYKLGLTIINKFQISNSIFLKLNVSAIKFEVSFNQDKDAPYLIKTDLSLEFHPLIGVMDDFYFGGGLFINYFLAEGYSEANKRFSMLSAFLNLGYEIPLTKSLSFNGEFAVEIFDIISLETKTKAYIGLSGTAYLLYHF